MKMLMFTWLPNLRYSLAISRMPIVSFEVFDIIVDVLYMQMLFTLGISFGFDVTYGLYIFAISNKHPAKWLFFKLMSDGQSTDWI